MTKKMHLKHRFESHFDINIKNPQQYTCKKDKIVLSLQRGSPKKIRQSQTDFDTKHHIRQKSVASIPCHTIIFACITRSSIGEGF